jgi:WD40 repeat protein
MPGQIADGLATRLAARSPRGTIPEENLIPARNANMNTNGRNPIRKGNATPLFALVLAATAAVGGGARGAPRNSPTAEELSARFAAHEEPLPAGAVARLGTGRLRHSRWVSSLDFSPDGKLLVSGGDDGLIRFWDMATGLPRQVLARSRRGVAAVVFSPDGSMLASTDWDGETPAILVWDVKSGVQRLRCPKDPAGVLGMMGGGPVVFSPDGKTLAGTSELGDVLLWDAATGRKIAVLGRHDGGIVTYPHVRQLAFAPDGRILASCARDGAVRLWDVVRHKPLHVLRSTDTTVGAIAFSRDGRQILSGGGRELRGKGEEPVKDGAIRVWDVASGKPLHGLRDPDSEEEIDSLALAPDGRTLAVSIGGMLRLWDLKEGKPLRSLAGRRNRYQRAHSLRFSPDGKILAGALGNAIALWETSSSRLLTPRPEEAVGGIVSVAFSGESRLLAAADEDGTVGLWDFPARRLVHRLRGQECAVRHVAVSPDGQTVTTATEVGTIRLWEARTGRELHQLSAAAPDGWQRLVVLGYSPDGKVVASSYYSHPPKGGPRGLRLWDADTGKELQKLDIGDAAADPLAAVAFSADGRRLTARTLQGQVYRWRVDAGRFVGGLAWQEGPQAGLIAFSADATVLAHCENGITLQDVGTGRRRQTLLESEGFGWFLAFSPDGRYLAALAGNGRGGDPQQPHEHSLGVWELASAQTVLKWSLPPHSGVEAVAFPPDGRFLVTGMSDSTILVWDMLSNTRGTAPGPERLRQLWAELGHGDAGRAHRALAELAASGEEAVTFLGQHLEVVRRPAPAQLARFLADLDSPQFDEREKAAKELEAVAETIRPELERLAKAPSAEVRRRASDLLEGINDTAAPAVMRRPLRAVAILEHIGTPAAQDLLRRLATGPAEARLTREAKAALDRLARRKTRP